MTPLTRFFPGLRDPFTCAALLLALGLYTAALFLPAFESAARAVVAFPPGPDFAGVSSGLQAAFAAPQQLGKALRDQWEQGLSFPHGDLGDLVFYWVLLARAWLPNALFWLGLFCLAARRGHPAWLAGAFALYEGAQFAAAAAALDLTLRAGYYVWLAGMAVLTAAGAYRALRPLPPRGLP